MAHPTMSGSMVLSQQLRRCLLHFLCPFGACLAQQVDPEYNGFNLMILTACGQPTTSTPPSPLAIPRPTPVPPDPARLAEMLTDIQSSLSSDVIYAQDFGFATQQEIDAATVGRPARTYLLAPAAIRAYQPGQRIADVLTDQREWAVPILVKGDLRILANVRDNGDWGMGSTSSTTLPLSYDDPATTVVFVTTRQIGVDLILLEQNGQEYLAVAQSPAYYDALRAKGHQPYPPEELLPALQQAVREKCGWLFRRC